MNELAWAIIPTGKEVAVTGMVDTQWGPKVYCQPVTLLLDDPFMFFARETATGRIIGRVELQLTRNLVFPQTDFLEQLYGDPKMEQAAVAAPEQALPVKRQSYPDLTTREMTVSWHQATVSKSVEINAAHWLPPHDGKCRFVHGHNYTFDVAVKGWYEENGDTDREFFVVEFATLDRIVKEVVGIWDHRLLSHYTQSEIDAVLDEPDAIRILAMFGISLPHVIPLGVYSTAENLSRVAAEQIWTELNKVYPEQGLEVSVTCWETPRTSALTTVAKLNPRPWPPRRPRSK